MKRMLNSKALKEDFCSDSRWCDPDDLPLYKRVPYFLKKWIFEEPSRFIRRYLNKIHRAYEYAKYSWDDYDWDMSYAYQIFNFKLKRLHTALENGHAIQEPEDMKALRELTKIVHRLGTKNYDRKYHRLHNKKWGKIQVDTIPNYDEDGKVRTYTWNSWRVSTKDASDETKEQERKEFLACWELGEQDRCKDIDRMAFLLKKHATSWWD
jgi:hypothetical protein